MPPKYYGEEPRGRGGGSSDSFTTRPGPPSGLNSAPDLLYTVPRSMIRPAEPSMHTTPQMGGPDPRPLGLSPAATNPGRQPSPSSFAARSSSSPSPSVQDRPGSRSAGTTGGPGSALGARASTPSPARTQSPGQQGSSSPRPSTPSGTKSGTQTGASHQNQKKSGSHSPPGSGGKGKKKAG
ncbi:hypothetical protein ASPVEDRAFT_34896 [Aspergillus versicolor CBS 583.65]|uniref:Uncharacterized protein n=1 Tax=Aspergillus versicolor CBS 583.65 TaxID=1036611 RepID=A0A1L9Q4Q9_ASPVE|nr:uncharacterized protein ASPVEDRAFT_34896 [Aspergillus versicolor CBS 583.65]OJJ08765.1 hypothetical protein ASPVEDRAFT_34896 [Aspergillus versicolor CBS 583.65]